MINRLITLRAIGRSGSLFVQQLFDSHPELVMLPLNFNFYQHWYTCPVSVQQDAQALVESYVQQTNLRYLLGEIHPDFRWLDESGHEQYLCLDSDAYIQSVHTFLAQMPDMPLRKQLLLALHQAFYQLVNKPWPVSASALFLHEHTPYYFAESEQDFDQTHHVVTMREPRNSYASYVKQFLKLGGAYGPLSLDLHLTATVDGALNALHALETCQLKVYFLSVEALNTDPQRQLQTLVKWLDLSYHETLIHPSCLGHPCMGNSAFDQQPGQFHSHILDNRWHGLCSHREIHLIQWLFHRWIQRFYPESTSPWPWPLVLLWLMCPDFQMWRLRGYAWKERFKYLLMLNFIWSRWCWAMNLWRVYVPSGQAVVPRPFYWRERYKSKIYLRLVGMLK